MAQHCDAIRVDDDHIGKILASLKGSGLEENTIVVYLSDHGANHLVRHKQMPTEGGLHVPFVLMGPEKWVPKQGARKDLVSTLDLTATTSKLGGNQAARLVRRPQSFRQGLRAPPMGGVGEGPARSYHRPGAYHKDRKVPLYS